MKTLSVLARKNVLVPMEENPHRHIGEECAVTVADSPYYRRRIADGDLVLAPLPLSAAAPQKEDV